MTSMNHPAQLITTSLFYEESLLKGMCEIQLFSRFTLSFAEFIKYKGLHI